jgi:predicted AAA+ superfamily ATPase
MGVSLQSVVMGRLGALLDRIGLVLAQAGRVLALTERVLEEQVGSTPDPDLFDRHLAFRWDVSRGPGRLVPLEDPQLFDLDDLVGVDAALERLVANVESFVSGHPSNHVLLYGERGTGKSSAVRGLLGRFASRGLRVIEVHKDDLIDLPRVLAALRGVPRRLLLFCDDLSFDVGETRYRELKAALEGSLAAPPENVRIIATSNRRHLLPESTTDNAAAHLDEHGDLHMGEVIDERLALSERFGLVLGFYGFDQDTYLRIVDRHAAKLGLRTPRDELHAEALRWALHRSSRSGRTAHHFTTDLAGREARANGAGVRS